jgi:ribosomally synthesized peptide (two-chain TOMM family)
MPANITSGDDLLMNFRNAFLHTIARVWSGDKKFIKKVQTDPTGAMRDSGLSEDWSLDIELLLNGDKWEPTIASGWCGSERETITLRLPLDPTLALKDVDPKLWAQALADYYFEYPTLFGDGSTRPVTKEKEGEISFKQGLPAKLGNFSEFREFGSVTMRAIAIAWSSKEFRDLFSKHGVEGTLSALQNWLGYTSPWNLDIKVEVSKGARWTPDGKWQKLRPNKLTLYIPQVPPEDPSVWPIALSAFNETGPAYPFTCCT